MNKKTPKHRIVWQKWEDPLSAIKNQANSRITPDEDDDSFNFGEQLNQSFVKSYPMMATPMGIFPIPEPDTTQFDFWTGHTNFNITANIGNIIDTAEGVESLDIFTRYRFRIGVGRVFSSTDVKSKIFSTISEHLKIHN